MFLVTGGAGFIGSHLCEKLVLQGGKVAVLDSLVSGRKGNVPASCTFFKEDIRSRRLGKFLDGVETVYHLAAEQDIPDSVSNPVHNFDVNFFGSVNLLEACRNSGVKNFFFASSGGTIYGRTDRPADEKFPLFPGSPYAASKAGFESYLSAYSQSYGMNCCSLRLANVVGPRSEHGLIWDFFHKLKANPSLLEIRGDGKPRRSFVYVSDVVDAFLAAGKKLSGFEVYNVSNSGMMTVREVAETVCRKMSVSPELKFLGSQGKTDLSPKSIDSSKIRALGWKPRFSALQAVEEYLSYLNDNA